MIGNRERATTPNTEGMEKKRKRDDERKYLPHGTVAPVASSSYSPLQDRKSKSNIRGMCEHIHNTSMSYQKKMALKVSP